MKLTSSNVHNIFTDCLFEEQPTKGSKYILVKGLTVTVGFNPTKIKQHENEIIDLLNQINPNFKESVGGGYSFIYLCNDLNDNQWCDQPVAQEFMLLAMAVGRMTYSIDRTLWAALPGRVPYLVIPNEPIKVKEEIL